MQNDGFIRINCASLFPRLDVLDPQCKVRCATACVTSRLCSRDQLLRGVHFPCALSRMLQSRFYVFFLFSHKLASFLCLWSQWALPVEPVYSGSTSVFFTVQGQTQTRWEAPALSEDFPRHVGGFCCSHFQSFKAEKMSVFSSHVSISAGAFQSDLRAEVKKGKCLAIKEIT